MKMSPCNTFRFFAVFATLVLSIVGSPVPGLTNRQENIATNNINQDLDHQGSITVEHKNDVKMPTYINSLKLNDVKDGTNLIRLDSEGTKKNVNKNSYQTSPTTDKTAQNIDVKDTDKTTPAMPSESVTETYLSTTVVNMTSISQQAEVLGNSTTMSENGKVNPVNISNTTEKTNHSIQDLKFQNNDTVKDSQAKVTTNTILATTTVDFEHSTQVTLFDVREQSTMNTKKNTETLAPVANTETVIPAKTTKSMKSSSITDGVTVPTWKKYTVIDRKRVATTTDELSTSTDATTDNIENLISTNSVEATTVTDKSEVMVKSESAQGRISLQDAITSDIPSLEKLKSDLLSFPKLSSKSDTESTSTLVSTNENSGKTDMVTFMTTTFASTLNSESPNTVSSKRAGYIDLSAKNTTVEVNITLKPKDTESLQGPFDAETPDTQDESLDDKVERRVESQSQLAEDAIKEELLKEEMLNDNEEISKRHRDEDKQIVTETADLSYIDKANITQFDNKLVQAPHTGPDENLSVRPINSDKSKNTVLYPVNPNYKPLKKIEVQPAKPFVRDPDDNSWRNESLSSLGIVFKPKNSSKPFTQVLKNKTETEWNNLPEKDIKSEVPDLRVRLEQIAQKRKSKKKKIDSFGNVFYTDYEENSSSEENMSTPQVQDLSFSTISTTDVSTTDLSTTDMSTTDVSASGITIITPIQTTSLFTPTVTTSGIKDVPALTTTATPIEKIQTTPKKEPIKVTIPKRPKMFNLFDYYETNDDEDIADYLNMAKIDLKKYTVPIHPHTTYTPYTSPPLSVLYTNPMTQYTQERKGTIQYFPPRTTQRPKKNKHNNVRDKINPLTLTESPKHVLPISYHKLTTPYDSNVYYTNSPEVNKFKDNVMSKNFDQNLYLTTPPLTTSPDEEFAVIGNEGGYNRPNYVIKHYKDYLNQAAHEQEHGKRGEYVFTEPPAHDGTISDFIKPTTRKDKTTVTEDYDYESEFSKDLLDRFVANFNEKSGRFKSDFPVVYNNSIVHGPSYDEKDVAMSRAYFRRPYDNREYKPVVRDPYDPNCENVTVELSPAYELHYYVPEQEEKQEVEPKPIDLPVRYRL